MFDIKRFLKVLGKTAYYPYEGKLLDVVLEMNIQAFFPNDSVVFVIFPCAP